VSADIAVIGGGIMGSAAALRLAEGGMQVVVFERGVLCAGASGVNAGTLSIQIKRPELIPYALRGLELWHSTAARLGVDVGLHVRGGLTLAFTDAEVETLSARTRARRDAGAPIEMVTRAEAKAIEPAVTDRIVGASHCALDSSANACLTGQAYRQALTRAGVEVREQTPVDRIDSGGNRYEIHAGGRVVTATRLLLATGAWLGRTAEHLGVRLPVHHRINQVSVTERYAPIMRVIISHALGALTLKQSDNGTVLIGGGWQGRGDLSSGRTAVGSASLVGNLRLATFSIPALSPARLVRTWLGFEAHVPDFMPIAGPLPSQPNAFVLGCVRGGWTIGPFIGQLVGDQILGRTPDMPLFDPARTIAPHVSPETSHAHV
jgi:glycine/D-amino acid oxidase-like deaminating enzyme